MKSACGQRASMQEYQTTDDPHPGRQTRLLARTGGLDISLSGYRVARTDTCYTLTRIGHGRSSGMAVGLDEAAADGRGGSSADDESGLMGRCLLSTDHDSH